nr:hypothetical protein [Streptomyces acidicola]
MAHRRRPVKIHVAGEAEVQGRQMRQDMLLAQTGMGGAAGLRAGGACVAVAAPVAGAAVTPVGFHAAAADAAAQQACQEIGAAWCGVSAGAEVLDGDEVGLANQRGVRGAHVLTAR